jgi:RNA polymerase sigma factor (sigma-70 family)
MIFHFVWLNKGQQEEAKDLFQDGIIILLDKLRDPSFNIQYTLKTFFYSICRNQWLKRWRNKKHFTVMDSEEYLANIPEPVEEKSDLPEDEQIYQAIEQLQGPCYTLLIGYYYEKLKLEQLAQALHYSTANVAKQRKFRCLERLKKMFLH